jgi:hypothetical protein
MKKIYFTILILFLLSRIVNAKPMFEFTRPDTTIKVTQQDSVVAYDSTLIFLVLKNQAGSYKYKKIYFKDLKKILNVVLEVDSIRIPRLEDSTSILKLKKFVDNNGWKSDFNKNFDKIDTLAILLDPNDFAISGDTVRIKSSYVPDSSAIAAQAAIANSATYLIGAYGVLYGVPDFALANHAKFATLYHDYGSSYIQLDLNGSTYKTLRGMMVDTTLGFTVTDSTMVPLASGMYQVTVTGTVVDTASAPIFVGLFINNILSTRAGSMVYMSNSQPYGSVSFNTNIKLTATQILKIKILGTVSHDLLDVYNINFSAHKL